MDTLEALRGRIETTRDLQSIVRTMKSLSAVSIRQYSEAVVALRDYHHTIELGLQVVLRRRRVAGILEQVPDMNVGIVFGSDHGLCARFNEQIADYARRAMRDGAWREAPTLWLTAGVRAASRLEAQGERIDEALLLPGAVSGLTALAERILVQVERWQERGHSARVLLFHNARTDDATASPRMVQLLPLNEAWLGELQAREWKSRRLPVFRMSREQLFSALVRQHLFIAVYRAGAESMASEHATRLAAMQAAERNIEEHLEEMNTEFRQRRQQSITEELLDLAAGFEALAQRR